MYCIGFCIFIFLFVETDCWVPKLRTGFKEVDTENYPYIVKLAFQFPDIDEPHAFSTSCTVTVLTPTWALTAAICISGANLAHPSKPIVYVIDYSPNITETATEKISKILSINIHPNFRFIPNYYLTFEYNMALLKTEEIELKEYARLSAMEPMAMIGHAVEVFGYPLEFGVTRRPLLMFDVVVTKCVKYICGASRCWQSSAAAGESVGGPVLHRSGIIATYSGASDLKTHEYGNFKFSAVATSLHWILNLIKA
ncbi:uncharacterized protein LOC113506789 [Trichoplusia ni]|uniref:Uncharacterized protein LOC113506789 n=1 Tax=Trichoplusia ni TaxID=7111 RepID=A0A7E5WX68_TRINI|nr:uncharacterized protein LOC113506789 [Trichoplusia ni]